MKSDQTKKMQMGLHEIRTQC